MDVTWHFDKMIMAWYYIQKSIKQPTRSAPFLLKSSNYNMKGVCYDDNIKVSLNMENLIISEPPFQIFSPDIWSKMKFIICIPVLNSALITPISSVSFCK